MSIRRCAAAVDADHIAGIVNQVDSASVTKVMVPDLRVTDDATS